jgi:hypothetical protein
MSFRLTACLSLIALVLAGDLLAAEIPIEDGLYEVQFRLELPHLETHAVDQKTTICIDKGSPRRHGPPLPLLSQSEIFSGCRIENIRQSEAGFSYDIACEGRGAARAIAVYAFSADAFSSRISITQGAKNMTMTEVQRGRRLGRCGGS